MKLRVCSNITGTLQAYFENLTLANAFINGTSGQIQFTLGTVTAEKYTLNLPVVKLSKGTVVAGGNDQDVVVDCAFQAIKDPSTLKSIIITKAVA